MTRRIQGILKLQAVSNLGPARTRKLFSRLKEDGTELEYLVEYEVPDLIEAGLNEDQAAQFVGAESLDMVDHLADLGLEVISTLDSFAPSRMFDSKCSPWYFYAGRLDILQSPTVGVAGSRDASLDAIELATRVASSAATQNWSVVSGGARGVDSASHRSATENGGDTIFVLPQGIATWSTPKEVDLEHSLILSEFSPLDEWSAYRAMQRNKSVVELSDLMIIPQSGEVGGTWNAGEYALKQRKALFVADLGPDYPGNQKLIRMGGIPLEWSGSILDLSEGMPEGRECGPSQASLF